MCPQYIGHSGAYVSLCEWAWCPYKKRSESQLAPFLLCEETTIRQQSALALGQDGSGARARHSYATLPDEAFSPLCRTQHPRRRLYT